METRFRHTQLDTAAPVVTTHCTVDSGDGTFQTAVTFRCSSALVDVVSVQRPNPRLTVSSNDRSDISQLFRGES